MNAYELAKQRYAEFGVDTDAAIARAKQIPATVHCWQVDDLHGFESSFDGLSGGIQTTGNHPGLPRNPDEVKADLSKVMSMIPGKKKIGLHASYNESGGKADRNEILPEHFDGWIDWAKDIGIGIDFNSTFFAHPKSDSGYTLASPDPEIRKFWVEHGKCCEDISEYIGQKMGERCVHNLWIPDGEKEFPVDTRAPRERLVDSLDQIIANRSFDWHRMAVESKLFGIGSESYVAGSHEFYMGYCMSRDVMLSLDMGHYHPTESIAAKISALLMFVKAGLNMHISRPVRWDSDHVVAYDDETRLVMREVIRSGMVDKVAIGTDFFDASINRVIALSLGVRNTKKAILEALLEPTDMLKKLEREGQLGSRLAYLEELKTLPFGSIWDEFCHQCDVPTGKVWIEELENYERDVLLKRV